MKILFITPYSSEGASNRYRVEQYLPYLKDSGFEYSVRPFVSSEFYRIIYKKGHLLKKARYFFKGLLRRARDTFDAGQYDVIFIHREACPLGPPFFEWAMCRLNKPIVFDFDDAIFMPNFNPANRLYSFLKFPSKTKGIIKMATSVMVANRFLEDYARKYNSNVHIIPTVVDTEKFIPSAGSRCGKLTIGWVGSPTTAPYLTIILNALRKLAGKHDFVFRVVGAGMDISVEGVMVDNSDWQLKSEIEDFQNIDIGVYPIMNTPWAFGKAGFKAIQYMSVAVPVVASPVGITREIIQDGVNGFLAASEEEWTGKLSALIEDEGLRKRIGLAGRKTIEEKFSVKVNAPKFIKVIKGSL